jgi:prepilin-type N-terminal cleavage/methylation domain-containing protein/prepilin-type processing-associated H-X9-DG protein
MLKPKTIRTKPVGMSLVELLVVLVIIALLLAILLPVMGQARQQVRRVVCASNLHNLGQAIHAYAVDFDGSIPFGPAGRAVTGSNFYTVTGNVTSLLSLENGAPVGLGLLLRSYLAQEPEVLFCPSADQPSQATAQLARVGHKQAQCDYYYRHASVAMLTGKPQAYHVQLDNLGSNRQGLKISSLVMDVQFLAHPSLSPFQVVTRTNHLRKTSNILFADGQVISTQNLADEFTVNIGAQPYDAIEKILRMFELADERH